MPFCASCGASMEGKFCGKCGAGVNAADPAAAGPTPGFSGAQANPVAAPMADNVASALCYVLGLITGIVFLVMEPYSKNRAIKFHAFQSIFLNVLMIVVNIVFTIFFRITFSIIGFGVLGILTAILWPVFWLAFVGAWLYMIILTYQGKTIVLPIIGPLAQKQAQS